MFAVHHLHHLMNHIKMMIQMNDYHLLNNQIKDKSFFFSFYYFIFLPTSSDELIFNEFDVVEGGGTDDTSFLLSICESKYCTEKFFI